MEIITVQLNGDGYLVNGDMYVPNDPGNRHCIMVQEWIATGNTPEPEYTPQEIEDNTKASTVATSKSEIAKTSVTMSVDGYQRMTAQEQAEMTSFRDVHFDNIAAGGTTDPNWNPVVTATLQVVFNKFRI